MAPMLQLPPHPLPRYKESLTHFFSAKKTQDTLLHPFQTHLRGFKSVQIRGAVLDPLLAKTVTKEMAQDKWTNEQKVLNDITTAKERGNQLFREGNLPQACEAWQYAAEDVERVHNGSSWNGLVAQDGQPFATSFAEIYFSLMLNVAHAFLSGVDKGMDAYPPILCFMMARAALGGARRAFRMSYWMDGFKWTPADSQMAKYLYRQTSFSDENGRREEECSYGGDSR